jgi:hypothetical protein
MTARKGTKGRQFPGRRAPEKFGPKEAESLAFSAAIG